MTMQEPELFPIEAAESPLSIIKKNGKLLFPLLILDIVLPFFFTLVYQAYVQFYLMGEYGVVIYQGTVFAYLRQIISAFLFGVVPTTLLFFGLLLRNKILTLIGAACQLLARIVTLYGTANSFLHLIRIDALHFSTILSASISLLGAAVSLFATIFLLLMLALLKKRERITPILTIVAHSTGLLISLISFCRGFAALTMQIINQQYGNPILILGNSIGLLTIISAIVFTFTYVYLSLIVLKKVKSSPIAPATPVEESTAYEYDYSQEYNK